MFRYFLWHFLLALAILAEQSTNCIAQEKIEYKLNNYGKVVKGNREEVDADTVWIVPAGNGSIFVLGSDGKLWLRPIKENRAFADENVKMIAPAENNIYVLGVDGKLWLGPFRDGIRPDGQGRKLVDENVLAICPANDGWVLVLGKDGKLWLKKIPRIIVQRLKRMSKVSAPLGRVGSLLHTR